MVTSVLIAKTFPAGGLNSPPPPGRKLFVAPPPPPPPGDNVRRSSCFISSAERDKLSRNCGIKKQCDKSSISSAVSVVPGTPNEGHVHSSSPVQMWLPLPASNFQHLLWREKKKKWDTAQKSEEQRRLGCYNFRASANLLCGRTSTLLCYFVVEQKYDIVVADSVGFFLYNICHKLLLGQSLFLCVQIHTLGRHYICDTSSTTAPIGKSLSACESKKRQREEDFSSLTRLP